MKPKLQLVSNPEEFFKKVLEQATSSQKITLDVNTEYYLVRLLTQFMTSENLYLVDAQGEKKEDVLALLYGEAMKENVPNKKHESLKRLGDVSLYTAGFFGDSLNRKIVDIDYYISMGKSAYNNLAGMQLDKVFRGVFQDLSLRFSKFVDLLAEVSEKSVSKDVKDILRIYETWVKTGSERAEKQLKEAGIIPNKNVKKSFQ